MTAAPTASEFRHQHNTVTADLVITTVRGVPTPGGRTIRGRCAQLITLALAASERQAAASHNDSEPRRPHPLMSTARTWTSTTGGFAGGRCTLNRRTGRDVEADRDRIRAEIPRGSLCVRLYDARRWDAPGVVPRVWPMSWGLLGSQ